VFFFPSLRREQIELRIDLDRPGCVDRVELRLFREEVLERAFSQAVEGRRTVVQVAKLSRGAHRAVVKLACRDGSSTIASRQPIIVDQEGVIQFKVSGAECRCSER
jgi:hypothetical protein